jgi:hypothetical protein
MYLTGCPASSSPREQGLVLPWLAGAVASCRLSTMRWECESGDGSPDGDWRRDYGATFGHGSSAEHFDAVCGCTSTGAADRGVLRICQDTSGTEIEISEPCEAGKARVKPCSD